MQFGSILMLVAVALCRADNDVVTEVALGDHTYLSNACLSSSDCFDGAICSRFYRQCMSLSPPQAVYDIKPTVDILDPVNVEDPSIDEIVAFGEQILEYARVPMCSASSITGWNCTSCKSDFTRGFTTAIVASDSGWDTMGYAGYNPNSRTIILSFRGTNGFPDALLDIIFYQITPKDLDGCTGCKVEQGFHFAYRTIADPLLDAMELLLKSFPDYRVIVTGHSLGGGLANLAAVNLITAFNAKPELYTFAQVRAGNQKFADFVEANIKGRYRYVNRRDLVPHLPPEFMNYRQHGPEVWQKADGSYTLCQGGEDKACSSSVAVKVVTDHCTYLDHPVCECSLRSPTQQSLVEQQ